MPLLQFRERGTGTHRQLQLFAEGEIEGGAFLAFAFRPDVAAMALDDALDDGEANAGAGKLLRGMQPLENPKQPVFPFHIEAFAIVADEKNPLAFFLDRIKFSEAFGFLAG